MGIIRPTSSSSSFMHRYLLLLLAGLALRPSLARTGRSRSIHTFHGNFTPSESKFLGRRRVHSLWGIADSRKPSRKSLVLERIAQLSRGGSSREEEEESEYDSEEEEEYDDEEAEVDDETDSGEENEEESINTEGVRIEVNVQKYDEPFIPSPLLSIYTTVGVMYLSRKVDLFAPTTVRIIRFAFLAYLVLQQILLIFIRLQARRMNDQTPIELTNPLSNMLQNKLSAGDGDDENNNSNGMMKSLASSLLRSKSTVLEYDLQQTRSMQTGLILNMLMQFFLHFKMEQVQPVVMQTVNGLVQLVYSPLFQVYVLGRNLERPFKTAASMRMEEMKKNAAVANDATEEATAAKDHDEPIDSNEEDEAEEEEYEEEESEAEDDEVEESDDEEEEADEAQDSESNNVEEDDFDEDEDFSDPE